jgi:hypothetical protein
MDRNKIYESKARLYPVIISMIIPFILILNLSNKVLSIYNKIENDWNWLISIIPASLITGALIYSVKLLARSTSKALFQFPLFKENESKMPSTNILLWKDENLSKQNKILIREKIHNEIGLKLLNEEEEFANEQEARLLVADAVKQMRERTRDNLILFNYNCNYGFIRNFMGANIWSLLIVTTIGITNCFYSYVNWNLFFISLSLIVISFPVSYWILKIIGREYARQLYTTFLEL